MKFPLTHHDCQQLERDLIAAKDAAKDRPTYTAYRNAIELLHRRRMQSARKKLIQNTPQKP